VILGGSLAALLAACPTQPDGDLVDDDDSSVEPNDDDSSVWPDDDDAIIDDDDDVVPDELQTALFTINRLGPFARHELGVLVVVDAPWSCDDLAHGGHLQPGGVPSGVRWAAVEIVLGEGVAEGWEQTFQPPETAHWLWGPESHTVLFHGRTGTGPEPGTPFAAGDELEVSSLEEDGLRGELRGPQGHWTIDAARCGPNEFDESDAGFPEPRTDHCMQLHAPERLIDWDQDGLDGCYDCNPAHFSDAAAPCPDFWGAVGPASEWTTPYDPVGSSDPELAGDPEYWGIFEWEDPFLGQGAETGEPCIAATEPAACLDALEAALEEPGPWYDCVNGGWSCDWFVVVNHGDDITRYPTVDGPELADLLAPIESVGEAMLLARSLYNGQIGEWGSMPPEPEDHPPPHSFREAADGWEIIDSTIGHWFPIFDQFVWANVHTDGSVTELGRTVGYGGYWDDY